MKTIHALNFFLIGFAMCFSPAYWSNHFLENSMGSGNSALWLLLMGATQMVLGAGVMGLNFALRLTHFLAAWEPVPFNFDLPEVSWVLPESFYAGLSEDETVAVALRLQQQLQLGRA